MRCGVACLKKHNSERRILVRRNFVKGSINW